jgi:hypothetical protein
MNRPDNQRMWCPVPNPLPHVEINLQEIATRNDLARQIIAGFSTAFPSLADIWPYLDDALNDVRMLTAEVKRLSDKVQSARLDRANLLAAARATLAADRDDEPDPLSYLRDELDSPTAPSDDTGRSA